MATKRRGKSSGRETLVPSIRKANVKSEQSTNTRMSASIGSLQGSTKRQRSVSVTSLEATLEPTSPKADPQTNDTSQASRSKKTGHISANATPPQLSSSEGRLFLALENRIGYTPHTASELIDILEVVGWDINRAEAFFLSMRCSRECHRQWAGLFPTSEADASGNTAGTREESGSHENETEVGPVHPNHGPQLLGGLTVDDHIQDYLYDRSEKQQESVLFQRPSTFRHEILPCTISSDLDRRLAIQIFAIIIHKRFHIRLSRVEAALSLAISHYQYDRAISFYRSDERVSYIRTVLGAQFDHFRSTLEDKTEKFAQEDRDRRLALLITFTGRPDWYSLQKHLSERSDNLIESVDAWVDQGIKPAKPPRHDKAEGQGCRLTFKQTFTSLPRVDDCVSSLPNDFSWAPTPLIFLDSTAALRIDISQFMKTRCGSHRFPYSSNIPAVDRERYSGGVINHDAEVPYLNTPDWTKFQYEYIAKGKYWSNKYKQRRTPDEQIVPGDNREMFDWANQTHVRDLRKWRQQQQIRATGTSLREASQSLSLEEKKFLWDQVATIASKVVAKHDQDGFFRVLDHCEDIAAALNTRFAGKYVPSDSRPRRRRQKLNIYSLTRQWPLLCRTFNIKPEPGPRRTDRSETKPWSDEFEIHISDTPFPQTSQPRIQIENVMTENGQGQVEMEGEERDREASDESGE